MTPIPDIPFKEKLQSLSFHGPRSSTSAARVHVINVATFKGGSVTPVNATVTPTAIAGTATIPGPTDTATANVSPGAVAATAAIGTPAIVSPAARVTPVTIAAVASIGAMEAESSATVTPDTIAAVASLSVTPSVAETDITVTLGEPTTRWIIDPTKVTT